METNIRSLYPMAAAVLTTAGSLILMAVLTATSTGQSYAFNLSEDDDRGSGRIAQGSPSLVMRLFAIRGSGRIDAEPNQPNGAVNQENIHFAWRGSGRLNENPKNTAYLGALQA